MKFSEVEIGQHVIFHRTGESGYLAGPRGYLRARVCDKGTRLVRLEYPSGGRRPWVMPHLLVLDSNPSGDSYTARPEGE